MTLRSATANLLDELQEALATGTVARRIESLRRVTDLFLQDDVDYSDEQITLFDDIFICLILEMETSAKEVLARRLAPAAEAPPRVIRSLAFDHAISVAGPVLTQSNRLDDATLIENIRTRSQQHMLAIAGRARLTPAVADTLIVHGNDDVVSATARNPGAEFSEGGYDKLMARASDNDALIPCIALRPSIPRHHYLKLVAKASASVRARLEAAHPEWADSIPSAVHEIARRVRAAPAEFTPQASIAHGLVRSLFEEGRLDEEQVQAFTESGRFDEASAAIACLAHVPIAVSEAMMVESRIEGIFILSKVAGFAWPTVQAIIAMRARLSGNATVSTDAETEANRNTYQLLRLSTAQHVLRFQRMQQADTDSITSPA